MRHYIGPKPKDVMGNAKWLEMMVGSVYDKLNHKINDLGMTKEQAIIAVKDETCAGSLVWEKALSLLN